MSRVVGLRAVLAGVAILALIVIHSAAAQSPPTTLPSEVEPVRTSQPKPATIDELVDRLGHPRFETRLQATARLCDAPVEALPRLVEIYAAQRNHEIKLRLRQVIEHVYYRQLMQGRMGFMGVRPQVAENIFDPRAGKGIEAVILTEVLADFPAEKAGLKHGDIIVQYEGRPVSEVLSTKQVAETPLQEIPAGIGRLRYVDNPRLNAFTADVAQREPGSTVSLRVLRCRDEVREIRVPLAEERGKTLEGLNIAPTQLAPPSSARGADANARAAGLGSPMPMFPGLCVAGVVAGSRAVQTGLEVGDVIVGFDGEPLKAGNSPSQLSEAVKTTPAGQPLIVNVVRLESVAVTVTLGGRPVDRINDLDLEIARMKFAAWWRDRSGEQSIRSPSEFVWMGVPPSPPKPAAAPLVLP